VQYYFLDAAFGTYMYSFLPSMFSFYAFLSINFFPALVDEEVVVVESGTRAQCSACRLHGLLIDPEDGGSTFLRNTGITPQETVLFIVIAVRTSDPT
jgi:hypothetical protein